MRTFRSTTTAALLATVIAASLLTGCGSDEPSDSSDDPSSSTTSESGSASASADPSDDPTKKNKKKNKKKGEDKGEGPDESEDDSADAATPVSIEPFCDDLDVSDVGDALGIDNAEMITELEPGDRTSTGTRSHAWSCTIGQTDDSRTAVTFTVLDRNRGSAAEQLVRVQTSVGTDDCTDASDDALGVDTVGADCTGSNSSDMPDGFTFVGRVAPSGEAMLECYLASADASDLDDLSEAAPDVCEMLLDAVG